MNNKDDEMIELDRFTADTILRLLKDYHEQYLADAWEYLSKSGRKDQAKSTFMSIVSNSQSALISYLEVCLRYEEEEPSELEIEDLTITTSEEC